MAKGPTNQTTTTKGTSSSSSFGTSDASGQTTQQGSTSADVTLPDYLQSLIQGLPGMATTQIQDLTGDVGGFQLDPAVLQQLQSTVGGDYLYGGPAQQAFIDAAKRAAAPGIFSQFGAAGRAGSGLEATALGQAGIDAYARLYDSERSRQLQAAQMLPQFQQLPIELKNQLLQTTLGVPGAFSPLFGRTGETSGTGTSTQHGTTSSQMTGKNLSTTSTPIYQPSPLEYGIAGLGLLGSFI